MNLTELDIMITMTLKNNTTSNGKQEYVMLRTSMSLKYDLTPWTENPMALLVMLVVAEVVVVVGGEKTKRRRTRRLLKL